jgi:diguanylate cyclase (GGDEF)-like protein
MWIIASILYYIYRNNKEKFYIVEFYIFIASCVITTVMLKIYESATYLNSVYFIPVLIIITLFNTRLLILYSSITVVSYGIFMLSAKYNFNYKIELYSSFIAIFICFAIVAYLVLKNSIYLININSQNYNNGLILKKAAELDGLTGLNIRRHFFELAQIEWQKTLLTGKPISVLMIDIDHFKRFNDTYGHDIGDKVLVRVAETIYKTVRDKDIVGRYGGEEFAVVLSEALLETARIIADRIRKEVENQRILTENSGELNCSVSIGIGTYSGTEKEIEELFMKADKMLYKAKEGGRNKIEG